jgi:hypothetical protein
LLPVSNEHELLVLTKQKYIILNILMIFCCNPAKSKSINVFTIPSNFIFLLYIPHTLFCKRFPPHTAILMHSYKKKTPNSVASLCERTIPTERLPLSEKSVSNFADRGCHLVSVMDPYSRILGFLDRSRYFFFQASPQLYSRG